MSGAIVEGIAKMVETGAKAAKNLEGISSKSIETGQEISETSLNELGAKQTAMILDMEIIKESVLQSLMENLEDIPMKSTEIGQEISETSLNELETERTDMIPDMEIIKESALQSLMENFEYIPMKSTEIGQKISEIGESGEDSPIEKVGLTEGEKAQIIKETGWSSEIVDYIENMQQYEIYKNAELHEAVIDGRKCLIKDIDMDYVDPKFDPKENMTNRKLMELGRNPIDAKTGEPIELHHMGQDFDGPLAELCANSEHGDGKDGILHNKGIESWRRDPEKKNQYNNTQRPNHWKARAKEA